jgi:hypothetical protein
MYCPHCGEKDSLNKNGFRERKNGKQPMFKCKACKRTTANPLEKPPAVEPAYKQYERKLPTTQRLVITAAQNATPPARVLETLKVYCKHNDAELVIVPIRYKNPTSTWSQQQQSDDWWHPEVEPYLYSSRAQINENLVLLGDIRTQPTAILPLTGFESITGARSGILAHPKVQLRSIPTPNHKLPKLMTTTGACTIENYTDSVTGKKGEFHHSLGAVVVEVDGGVFHMRQLSAMKDGTLIDLNKKYSPKGVTAAPPAEALIFGDTHAAFADKGVAHANFNGPGSMVSVLNPKRLVWHDVFDNYAQNWHDKHNPFFSLAKHQANMSSLPAELKLTCDYVNKYGKGRENVIIPSNHNEGLERWIRDTNWKDDPTHMEFYLETALAMVRNTEMTEHGARTPDPFIYWAEKLLTVPHTLLERDQAYAVKEIELSMHGDIGPNGARGSIANLRRIGVKSIIGHSHSPGIEEGCFQTGTNSKLRVQYNRGPSSWMHTNCVVYANGKRSLLHVVEGSWKL